jgi:hypothetical protein
MGGDQNSSARLLQEEIPVHFQGGTYGRKCGSRVASKEQIQTARTESFHVRVGQYELGVCRLYRIYSRLSQTSRAAGELINWKCSTQGSNLFIVKITVIYFLDNKGRVEKMCCHGD